MSRELCTIKHLTICEDDLAELVKIFEDGYDKSGIIRHIICLTDSMTNGDSLPEEDVRTCPECGEKFDKDYGHSFDCIGEHRMCIDCFGYDPYARYNKFDVEDKASFEHFEDLEEYLNDWNENHDTDYKSIDDFNKNEEYYYIVENGDWEDPEKLHKA